MLAPLVEWIEKRYNIVGVTEFAIELLSAPLSRALFGLTLLTAAIVLLWAVRRFPAPVRAVLFLSAIALVLWAAFGFSVRPKRLLGLVLAWGLALVLPGRKRLFGLFAASVLSAVFLMNPLLVESERTLRLSKQARVIERDNYNWMEMDASGRYLFATGHGLSHLRRYDLEDLSAAPLWSDADTHGAQSFAYDSLKNEIYVYDREAATLVYLDAPSLAFKRSVPRPKLSMGDAFMAADPHTDTVIIVSEANRKEDWPFVMVDRSSGETVAHEQELSDTGHILLHPSKPWLYMSFFRHRKAVMTYDLAEKRVLAEAPVEGRTERLVFDKAANELYVAAPMNAKVLRFDADTLRLKGSFPAPYGTRALALDRGRGLLLMGSLVTGEVRLLELASGKKTSHYIGPWLRTITSDERRGKAYISSNGALYELKYV